MANFSDKTPPSQTMLFRFNCTQCRQTVEQGASSEMIFALVREYPGSNSVVSQQHEVCTKCAKFLKENNAEIEKQMAEEAKTEKLPTGVLEKEAQLKRLAPPVDEEERAPVPPDVANSILTALASISDRLTALEEKNARPKRR